MWPFKKKSPDGFITLSSLDEARRYPQLVEPGAMALTRAEAANCLECGAPTADAVLTSGGPAGEPEVFHAHPVALDVRRCTRCEAMRFPIALADDERKALLTGGDAAGRAGKLDEAELHFRRAANAAPDFGLARASLGSVYLERTRAAAKARQPNAETLARVAVRHFRDALASKEDRPLFAQFLLGQTLVELGEIEEGHAALREFIANPDSGPLQKEAQALLERRDWKLTDGQARAYEEGNALIDLKRFLPVGHVKNDTERDQLTRGIALLDTLLTDRPDHWPSWWISGKASAALRRHDEAYDRFQKAYLLNPDHADVAREYGGACLVLGKADEGLAATQKAVANDPSDVGLQANLALAMLISGNDAGAEQVCEAALAKNPADKITQGLLDTIRDVKSGKIERPSKLEQ